MNASWTCPRASYGERPPGILPASGPSCSQLLCGKAIGSAAGCPNPSFPAEPLSPALALLPPPPRRAQSGRDNQILHSEATKSSPAYNRPLSPVLPSANAPPAPIPGALEQLKISQQAGGGIQGWGSGRVGVGSGLAPAAAVATTAHRSLRAAQVEQKQPCG